MYRYIFIFLIDRCSSPIELEIKDTTDTDISASYLEIYSKKKGGVRTKHYNKRDDFNFPIVNFPFIHK